MIKACVIGDPIAHSRSPLIHGYWLKKHGIAGSYERVHVHPGELQDFFQRLKNGKFAGCNVTIPHKETAIALVDYPDERVKACGALNTVFFRDGKLHATTTDGMGFCANVLDKVLDFQFADKTILVYGAGGSSRPIIDECLRRGAAKIFLANRTKSRADDIARHFGEKLIPLQAESVDAHLPQCDLFVNCTSLGMKGEGEIPVDLALLPGEAIVADIVYVPLITSLLRRAQARGLRIVPGLGMLLHQAAPGFELWFGQRPQVTKPLHDLIARDIDPHFKSLTVIGLTGSIAMGKSEVANILKAEGLPVFDADKEVHALYDSEEGANLLRPFVPEAIVNGKVDRTTLSQLVMADKSLLERLEKIVHLEVARRRIDFLEQARADGHDTAVVDVPLLFEKNNEKDVDFSVVVSAPEADQRARALARPGMTVEKLAMILSRQMPDTEKRRRADFVIENNGSLADLRAKTLAALTIMRQQLAGN